VANALTMSRLLLIPAFIYFLARSPDGSSIPGACLFILASLTDWLDGWVARRTATVSEFGRVADPLADHLLIGSALIILLVKGALPTTAVMVLLVRDAYILAGSYVLSRRGIRINVTLLGKLSTAVLFVALALVILGIPGGVWVFRGGTVLAVVSAVAYTVTGFRQFRRPRPRVPQGRQLV
jgi:CDP-diacylglycerol--glycerol-3-phosphate 3-phosphatidyltransferase